MEVQRERIQPRPDDCPDYTKSADVSTIDGAALFE